MDLFIDWLTIIDAVAKISFIVIWAIFLTAFVVFSVREVSKRSKDDDNE